MPVLLLVGARRSPATLNASGDRFIPVGPALALRSVFEDELIAMFFALVREALIRKALSAVWSLMNRTVWSFLLGAAMLSLPVNASERVHGAALVESAESVEAVIFDLAKLPLEKAEIEWFLRDSNAVLGWANANVDRWREADESDQPLVVIRAFPVWDRIDLSGPEFVAVLAKLLFLREFMQDGEQLKGLKSEIAQMDEALASGRLTGYVEEMAIREISRKQQFVDILEAAGARNLKLYKANQERIDPVLDRFAQIGESP